MRDLLQLLSPVFYLRLARLLVHSWRDRQVVESKPRR
jgi:hypothetical protein